MKNYILQAKMKYVLIFLILYFVKQCESTIYAYDDTNATSTFSDSESQFGTTIGPDGMIGILASAEPLDACQPLKERPYPSIFNNQNISVNAFALIARGGCDFAVKVLNAQKANFNVAIVYNVGSDKLVEMGTLYPEVSKQISIPSVFIGQTAATILNASYLYFQENSPMIEIFDDASPFSLKYYIIPFLIVLSTCFVGLMFFMGVRYIRDRRRTRRNRLSRQRLKQLPTKLFVKGDEYDVCAICLDDYDEGDNLRILPCHHAYHCACVDPWLTTSKRVCPLCKRRVLSDDESSNNSNSDSEDESAPLISSSPASSANAARYGTGFSPRNPFLRDYSHSTTSSQMSDEESVPTTRNMQQHQQLLQQKQQTLVTSSEETPSTSYDPRFTLLIDVSSTDPNTSSDNSFSSSSTLESHHSNSVHPRVEEVSTYEDPHDGTIDHSPDNSPSFYTLSSASDDDSVRVGDNSTPPTSHTFPMNPVLGESPGAEVVVIVQGGDILDDSSCA